MARNIKNKKIMKIPNEELEQEKQIMRTKRDTALIAYKT